MSTPSKPRQMPVTSTWQETGAYPGPSGSSEKRRSSGRSGSGYGIVSLCLAAAAFFTAPFLLLIPVAGFVPAVLAAVGIVVAWLGLRRSERTPGLAIAGSIVSVVLFGLTLSIAILWTLLVVAPAVSDYQQLHDVIDRIRAILFGS